MKKKQQQTKRRRSRRLSRHVPVSSNLHITFSTEIPIVDPVTKEEMLMGGLSASLLRTLVLVVLQSLSF